MNSPATKFSPPVYLDHVLLVVNKPAGLPVLPDGWQPDAPYLLDLLQQEYGRLWVVHRLDKSTSGVMLFARTAEAHRILNLQFDQHEVEKVYHAIVTGTPAWDEQICRLPLRVNVGHRHRTVVDEGRGKISETRFHILKRGQAAALVEARPKTGRTHQIRAHLSALGFPLLGDFLYGAPISPSLNRPALHAVSLAILHPDSKQRLVFSAAYPPDFEAAIALLGF
ncbi:MAG: RluA family pseudouridine synthase [Anaerolineales bacterium]